MRTKLIFVVTATMLLVACNSNDEVVTSFKDDTPQVSNEFAMSDDEVTNLLNFFVNDGATTRSDGKTLTIKDYTVKNVEVKTEEKTEYIPVYEYTTINEKGDEGYSIVVADSRIQKVLVQVEKGSLADTAKIIPLKWYINSIPDMVTADLQKYYDKNADKPVTRSTNSYVETLYCFLPTTWGQGEPYNLQCPEEPVGYTTVHCFAGCIPVAIAQILAYHRVPSSLNWTSILQYQIVTNSSPSTVITQVSNLIATLGSQTNTNYSLNGSSSTPSLMPSVIQSYSLNSGSIISFNLNDIILNLGYDRPVLLIGNTANDPITGIKTGHVWVCDGWKRHHYDPDYYDYLDMNWGWDGNSNGFYYISNPMTFITNVTDIVQDFQMITGVY